MIVITSYKRYENETDEELIYRICSEKEQIGSWQAVADILNELLNTEYTESKFRKQFQAFQKMLDANQSKFADINAQTYELMVQKRELERAKIQFRDERNAWQKQNYRDARIDQKLDYLEEQLASQGKILFEIHDIPEINSDNDLLVQVSDLHLGQCFSSVLGEYNSEIAKQRMNDYLNEIIKIQKRHNSENCIVLLQGDIISGNIHKVIQITNRENVIEQIKLAIEIITSFCYELTKHFSNVQFYNVSGNHSRIDRKDEALHDERLDDLIGWDVERTLSHIDNFHAMSHRKLDTGIADIIIRNKTYIGVHGDLDRFSKSGVTNLVMILGFIPEAICFGHMHHCSYDEESGVKMIRSGSLSGSGDDYTIEKRLVGRPSQMVTVCGYDGVQCCYPIGLK